MCTAVAYCTQNHYFGRNLDLEYSYQETVTITPRHYPFSFRRTRKMTSHYAIIGMAYVKDGYPLYYDATNEKGLSMAGLNFPGNAVYFSEKKEKDNIAPFEFIPWILGQCADLKQAQDCLANVHLINVDFSPALPLSPLHWMIADRNGALTVEQTQDGLHIYPNSVGVLTNNPPFDYQMTRLNDYMALSNAAPENHFSALLNLKPYSLGMGSLGLPGDCSSASRFVRAAFTKFHSCADGSEAASISQFFHILDAVAQPRGCTQLGENAYEVTQYSSCCNTDKGIYYYKTYDNSQISGIDMHRENLDGTALVSYPLILEQQIRMQN